MKLITKPQELKTISSKGVVALGNFDGFHRGHQAVIGEAGRIARREGVPLIVFTTEPHPRSYFNPDALPFRLMTEEIRNSLLEEFGVDVLVVLPFDANLASTSAQDFVHHILVNGLNVSHVVTGYDYRFGKGREGDADTLFRLGKKYGFTAVTVPKLTFGVEGVAGEIYSSTAVRKALREGKVRQAAALLGHWWSLSGKVIHGDKRGHELGFPTANIAYPDILVPRHGIYAIRVDVPSAKSKTLVNGVASLGTRPTFGHSDVLLEVHLFDFEGDLYDQNLLVQMVGFLRPEEKYDSVSDLIKQMHKDCEVAQTVLDDPENASDHFPPVTLDTYLRSHPKPLV